MIRLLIEAVLIIFMAACVLGIVGCAKEVQYVEIKCPSGILEECK